MWRVDYAGRYCELQPETIQVTTCPWVALIISGFKVWALPAYGICLTDPVPQLAFIPTGTKIHFKTKPPRLNYVAFLEPGTVERSLTPAFVCVRRGDGFVEAPLLTALDESVVLSIELDFIRMLSLYASPIERDRVIASLLLPKFLSVALESQALKAPASPALALKRLIELDDGRSGIAELSRRSGYSVDYARRLFLKEYGILPHSYQMRLRMTKAMEMLSRSRLSVKEISDRIGYVHLSQFSSAFKCAFGFPPSEAVRRFRQPGGGVNGVSFQKEKNGPGFETRAVSYKA